MLDIADYAHDSELLYAKEVREFMTSFTDTESTEEVNNIFSLIVDKWQESGFVPLQELRRHVCNSLASTDDNVYINKAKQQLMDRLINGAVQKDKLTGFYAKTDCPLVTGLADLYRRTTGHNVFRIDGDFSNMGGTNEFFRKELESRGWGRRKGDGFEYTDRLVSLSSRMMYEIIDTAVKAYNSEGNSPRAYLHPFRSGGDEIRFIVTGMDREKANVFVATCDNAMKKFINDNHLETHDNPKDARRPGFGFEMALVQLGGNSINSGAEADRIISLKKLLTSTDNLYAKAAQSTPEEAKKCFEMVDSINKELNKAIAADLKDRGYKDNEIDRAIFEREKMARIRKEKALSAHHEPPEKGSVLTIVENMNQDPKYANLMAVSPVPDGASIPLFYGRNDFFADINMIRERSVDAWAKNLLIKDENDLRIINSLAKNYHSIDSSTGVKMATALYNVMGRDPNGATDYDIDRFVKDVRKLQDDMGIRRPCQVKAAHVEFGNLAGMNCISHDFGDALLKDYAAIIKKTLKESGIDDKYAHAVYSEGGGKFKLVLPESYTVKNEDGKTELRHIDDKFMNSLTDKIKETVNNEINNKSVKEYCIEHGLDTDFSNVGGDKLQKILQDPNAKISDIPNPKRENEHGVNVHAAVVSIDDRTNASEQLNNFTNDFEAGLRKSREQNETITTRKPRYHEENDKIAREVDSRVLQTETPKYSLYRLRDKLKNSR